MSNHAPAPWSLYCNNKDEFVVRKMHPETKELCQIAKVNGYENARLIAAAPDLLAVCKELAESAAYWSEYNVPLGIIDCLHAAIAKATGDQT